jgi:serine/alanine adding enzyme
MFRVLRASDKSESLEWDALVARLPENVRDIHFTSAYGRVQELLDINARLFVLTQGDSFIIQPFVVRHAGENRASEAIFDIASPYGYGGPISNDDRASAPHFQTCIADVARGAEFVCEYCRFHPLFASHQMPLALSSNIEQGKQVVVVVLDALDPSNVERRVRRGLHKARDFEFCKVPYNSVEKFCQLYDASMDRLGAKSHFRFSHEYIRAHFSELDAKLYRAKGNGGTRMLMVIGSGSVAYAHLLGSNGEAKYSGLDELLYYNAGITLRNDGFKLFHLGGGTTDEPDDSLLRFKKGFGGNPMRCYSYKRVFDNLTYDALTAKKIISEIDAHGRSSRATFFPAYRREFA